MDPAFLLSSDVARVGIGVMLGAIGGSFFATVAVRWPLGRSVSQGRSACDGCGRTLPWYALIPLVSAAGLRGRCGRCGAGIDPLHLVMEPVGAVIGACALLMAPGAEGLAGLLLGLVLLTLAALDVRHYWLPDLLTLPLLAAGLAVVSIAPSPSLPARIAGAVAGYGGLRLIGAIYRAVRGRDGIGAGDAKLLAAIGAWLGWRALPLVLLGAALLALAAVAVAQLCRRSITLTTRVPFGAPLAITGWLGWVLALTS